MKQELGETTREMIKDDMRRVEQILEANPTGDYWILIHHKPSKNHLSTGEQIIVKTIKAYRTKPPKLIGTIVHEVKGGSIVNTDVNLHDAPIAWDKIVPVSGFEAQPLIQQSSIARDYLYNE